jgi:hypothetical protein
MLRSTSPGMALAVRAMTGMCAVRGSARSSCKASVPLMCGRLISIKISCGKWLRAISTPRRPSLAVSSCNWGQ